LGALSKEKPRNVMAAVQRQGWTVTAPWVPGELSPLPAIDPREFVKRSPRDWSWLSRPAVWFLAGVVVVAIGSVIEGLGYVQTLSCDLSPDTSSLLLSGGGLLLNLVGWSCIGAALSGLSGRGLTIAGVWAFAIMAVERQSIIHLMERLAGHVIC
jgi:hypothetical protein